MDCRMEVISRVVNPSLFKAEASSLTVEAPGGSNSSRVSKRRFLRLIRHFHPAIWWLLPARKGLADSGRGFRKMVILLLLTAMVRYHVLRRNNRSRRSLMMTRAGTSGDLNGANGLKKLVVCPEVHRHFGVNHSAIGCNGRIGIIFVDGIGYFDRNWNPEAGSNQSSSHSKPPFDLPLHQGAIGNDSHGGMIDLSVATGISCGQTTN